MTRASNRTRHRSRDEKETAKPEPHGFPGVTYHPRSPEASLDRLDQLAGIIKLTGPVDWRKLMDDEESEDEVRNHAGD